MVSFSLEEICLLKFKEMVNNMDVEKLCELKRNKEINRMGTLFYTTQSSYLYDTGTGKVAKLDSDGKRLLEALFNENMNEQQFREELISIQNIESICTFIEKEHLLCNPPITHFVDLSARYLEDGFRCNQLIIELTGKCTLRCKYCVYNDYNEGNRNFNTSNIDFETAKKAIDFIYAHNDHKKLAITFYGGEPLLNFKVMKQCIDYSLNNLEVEELAFSFTTNLTLMTKEIANYLAQIPNMSILLSVDGPEEIHDRSRVNQKGHGSFQDVYEGLKNIAASVNKYKKTKLAFNAVLMPPYTAERFEKINSFFEGLDFMPEGTEVRATYPSPNTIPDSYYEDMEARGETMQEETTWISWAKAKAEKDDFFDKHRNLYTEVLTSGLTSIHNRLLYTKPMNWVFYNGCCIPGERRLYVCTDGSYKICERVGISPAIGHVDTGIDTQAINKFYLKDYETKSLPDCSNCWAVNLCDICYAHCYDENGLNIGAKKQLCPVTRDRFSMWLQYYHELLETQPNKIEEISHIEIS